MVFLITQKLSILTFKVYNDVISGVIEGGHYV